MAIAALKQVHFPPLPLTPNLFMWRLVGVVAGEHLCLLDLKLTMMQQTQSIPQPSCFDQEQALGRLWVYCGHQCRRCSHLVGLCKSTGTCSMTGCVRVVCRRALAQRWWRCGMSHLPTHASLYGSRSVPFCLCQYNLLSMVHRAT